MIQKSCSNVWERERERERENFQSYVTSTKELGSCNLNAQTYEFEIALCYILIDCIRLTIRGPNLSISPSILYSISQVFKFTKTSSIKLSKTLIMICVVRHQYIFQLDFYPFAMKESFHCDHEDYITHIKHSIFVLCHFLWLQTN